MDRETPYSILGLDPACDEASLLAMYRHLAKTHHPDRGGDCRKFRQIQEAYEKINTPEKRRIWAEANVVNQRANHTWTTREESSEGATGADRAESPSRSASEFNMGAKHYYSHVPRWGREASENSNKENRGASLGARRWVKILTAAAIASVIVSYAAQRSGGTIMDAIENGSLVATLTIPWSYAAAGLAITYGVARAYIAPRSRWRSWRGGVCVGVACAVLANSGANAYFYIIGSIVAGIFLHLMGKSGWGERRISGAR